MVYEASSAYGTLGDEAGQSGTASLGDPVAAVAAYRQSIALDDRALRIEPNFLRAKRGLAVNRLKIGSVEMATDPAEALKEFQRALQISDALPKAQQASLSTVRLRAMLLRKQANAFEQLGAYPQAVALFEQALEVGQGIAAQDPKDSRALYDVVTVLDDEAKSYEDAADPGMGENAGGRRANLELAEKKLVQAVAYLERLLKGDPSNDVWRAFHGFMQVRIGAIRKILHTPGASDELSKTGLAALKQLAEKDAASPLILDQAANAFLWAEPAALRNPPFAVSCAERELAMSRGRTPSRLLTLAEAYRAAGQIAKSRAAAKEGLALLPVLQPDSAKPNIRKQLENDAQSRF
jgi:tetratricopeptide (TPR) repeat protein